MYSNDIAIAMQIYLKLHSSVGNTIFNAPLFPTELVRRAGIARHAKVTDPATQSVTLFTKLSETQLYPNSS